MSRWKPVGPASDWTSMEERVLQRWREGDVFRTSVEMRKGHDPYVFYEGPPTANGRPGSHHVLSRVFKDIFPRFHTMRGRYVERKAGWDCHGLPVELEVEKQLGISGKPEIEAYGIAEFNAKCRASVGEYLDEWERLTERIGFWVDTSEAYRTMDTDYVESVWWSLATLHDKGLVYESDKVVPYCPRCGTALSSHEVAQGYKDVTDPSIYVKFPLRADSVAVTGGEASLLVWTTTPWTLPANQAAAISPGTDYAVVVDGDERLVMAQALVGAVMGEDAAVERVIPAADLAGAGYDPPFDLIPGRHQVVLSDFVTTDDGTGIVHIAPAFGEDDMRAAREHGLDAPNPVDRQGLFTSKVPLAEGQFVKDADRALITDLEARGRVQREKPYEHSYPHCWRCSTPLLYYAKPSWYIRTTDVRDRMLELNASVGWHPDHVRDGRFGRWLEGNVDWAISRERYWGTPLPFWRCDDCSEVTAIGSFADLRERAIGDVPDPLDPHRPYVDDIDVRCHCGGVAHRVPEVADVWFDSGAMPFAQHHHPFEGPDDLAGRFPADFVCEALDQTRGWFYSLLAEGTLLFDESPYRNVVCLGLILDGDGQKMSKSKGNVVEPWTVIDHAGADAFRWYLFTAQSPWESFRFSLDVVDETRRRFLFTLWNTYAFLVTYAALPDGWSPGDPAPPVAKRSEMDRWALSRLDGTIEQVTARLAEYDPTSAGRALEDLVDDLSNWYVRTSRRRFWRSDDPADTAAAFATLHECLTTISLLVAPFCPFVADEMWGNLVASHDDTAPPSVHLADWPAPGARRDEQLERAMAAAMEATTLGRSARKEAKLKVRQPLAEAVIACPPSTARELEGLTGIVAEELNVRDVRFVTDAGGLVQVSLKPNYRTLGPRMGPNMPAMADAVAALDPTATVQVLDAGGTVTVSVNGNDEVLGDDDLLREVRPSEGYAVAEGGALAVGLATEITPELEMEGLARDLVRAIQNARRDADLKVEDRIRLHLDGSARIREAIDAHRGWIAGEVLATELTVGHGVPFTPLHREDGEIDAEPVAISLSRA
ncbi:MAG: isoleucine--tRNA ligase [Miltoncostaeaceae bacterium]